MSAVIVEVVAGIIFNEDQSQVLLALRKPDQHQGNCWEFPGGKIEVGEEIAHALVRELDEELGIQVTQSIPFCQIKHDYTDKSVHLHFWQVTQFDGEASGRENQQLKWFALAELNDLTFPQANVPVVAKLTAVE